MPVPTVLIAEDNQVARILLSHTASAAGFEPIVVDNGREALAMARLHAPDVLLLDINMPVMDGLEVLRRMKWDLETRNIPVVMITAADVSQSLSEALNLGAVDYITKPFNLDELVACMRRIVETSPGAADHPARTEQRTA